MHCQRSTALALVLAASIACGPVEAQQTEPAAETQADQDAVLAGHSAHGEVFNEGPRQQAFLMGGTGYVDFPVTTDDEEAQAFVSQGLGQIYGFWYFEAERSFRQAAAIDSECAMAYWGMAVANYRNTKRAQGFMAEAVKRKNLVTPREQKYIEAFQKYVQADPKKSKERNEQYAEDLEKLIYDYPDDVEAKALLALQLYWNRSKSTSNLAVDALMDRVFEVQPLHAAHHFRIHLWDHVRPEKALPSAALCGSAAPAIAHMWHMPGHIYSRLKRYNEAVWQQEASARTDHAHMMRDRVMPDQIHNFAHNNEWLIRNLVFVGRAHDALDLAKNMTELPRHPRYNTLARRGGSASYGRMRLLEVLREYHLWEEAVRLCQTPYIEPGDTVALQAERLHLLGEAQYRLGHQEQGDAVLQQVRQKLDEARRERDRDEQQAADKILYEKAPWLALRNAAGAPLPPWESLEGLDKLQVDKELQGEIDKARRSAARSRSQDVRELETAEQALLGWQHHLAGRHAEALAALRKARAERLDQIRVQFETEPHEAVKAAQQYVSSHKNEVLPLACAVELLWQAGQRDQARQHFETLREISGPIDLDTPVMAPLAEIARQLGHEGDWRVEFQPGEDFGSRPPLESLGPFRWQPSPAPTWTLSDAEGHTCSSKQLQGRPVVLIFFLGYGCLHCAEQLQAFGPYKDQFDEAGLDMIAISSDDHAGLKRSIENYSGQMPIPLVADPELNVFRTYRAYDDFEDVPLHGTFVIDGQGMIRWLDISYEPFMDPNFVLEEAQRLLASDVE